MQSDLILEPIGHALLKLRGGMLRAKQAMAASDLSLIGEERVELANRLSSARQSIASESYPSIPRQLLRNQASDEVKAAEEMLNKLTSLLVASFRVV